jgi:hypothetical protein
VRLKVAPRLITCLRKQVGVRLKVAPRLDWLNVVITILVAPMLCYSLVGVFGLVKQQIEIEIARN